MYRKPGLELGECPVTARLALLRACMVLQCNTLDRAWHRRVCCASPTRAPSTCHVPSTRNTHTHTALAYGAP
eukprot:89207-Prymnesium_polylepis.1